MGYYTQLLAPRRELIQAKLEEIKEWMEDNDEFDGDFVESLEEQFCERQDLSDRQIGALDNILEKWVRK